MNDQSSTQDRDRDIDAIEAVVATVQRTQREEAVDEFVALFREDAIWTTALGMVLNGRDEVASFTRRVLPGAMKDLAGTTYEVAGVLFIRPDVAAVKVRQVYAAADGTPVAEDPEGTPLYVMSKEDGAWLLAACQNTKVAPG